MMLDPVVTKYGPAPDNAQQLVSMLDTLFHCMDGPPRAFFELPLGEVARGDFSVGGVGRFVYETVQFGVTGIPEEAESQLVSELWRVLVYAYERFDSPQGRLRADGINPVLFWRRRPEVTVQPQMPEEHDRQSGVTLPARPAYTKIYCRLCIPGVKLWALTQGLATFVHVKDHGYG